MAMKCPNGHPDVAAALGDVSTCLTCGVSFDGEGNIVRKEDGGPFVVGNLADLHRLGAENAPKESEPEFVLPAGAEDAVPASEMPAPDDGGEQNAADDDKASKAKTTASKK